MAMMQQAQKEIEPLLEEAQKGGNPKEIQPKVIKIRDDLEAKLEALLTDAQKTQWKEMLGKPMDTWLTCSICSPGRAGSGTMVVDLDELARRMLADYDARTPGELSGEPIDLTTVQAYALQAEIARLLHLGGTLIRHARSKREIAKSALFQGFSLA